MLEIKDVMQRMRETKQERKKINTLYRDALAQSKSYQEVLDEMKALKAKKAQIENAIRSDFSQEMERGEKLKLGLQTDGQLLSDIALTKMMKGETVEYTDENEVKYEPVFKVSFKKAV
jgi:hypothetical protein